jgi:hypothetical protein
MNTARILINESCVVPDGINTRIAEKGETVEMPLEDALSVVGAGRGRLATPEDEAAVKAAVGGDGMVDAKGKK